MLLAAALILAPAAGGLLAGFWLLVRRLRRPTPVLLVPTRFDAWPPLPTPPQLPPGPRPLLLPPVVAIEKRQPDLERGDLVDMEGSPHVGVVICVDGDTAWCRLVKSGTRHPSGITSYEFAGNTIWPWPVDQCSIMDRSLVGFAVDN